MMTMARREEGDVTDLYGHPLVMRDAHGDEVTFGVLNGRTVIDTEAAGGLIILDGSAYEEFTGKLAQTRERAAGESANPPGESVG